MLSQERQHGDLISKLVLEALICIRFFNFVLPESWSGYQYESCSKETKVNYTALLDYTRFFYKKLGSGHSTESFLISHEILSILVLKVS